MRHRLTREATEDLLNLITFHLPLGTHIPSSVYLLRQKFKLDEKITTTHYYCEKCKLYLGNDKQSFCADCLNSVSPEKPKNENYFFTFDVRFLLQDMLKSDLLAKNIYNNLKARQDGTRTGMDIPSGNMYKALGLGDNDFTCLLNTDGVPAFKSSNTSLWPVLASVNEMDYNYRRNNVLLLGIWIGKTKPEFDTFLKPIVDMCNSLSTSPIFWKSGEIQINSKVYFPILTADSVARCQIQGINQFNGMYGCPWCLIKGKTYWSTERKHKWVYPGDNEVQPPRTQVNFITDLRKLNQILTSGSSSVKHIHGVKSASRLLLLKKFNIVNGFVFDIMHTAFLGVTRTFTHLWFDSCNSGQPYYIRLKQNEVNRRLKSLLLPFELSRSIRSLDEMNHWKASEWRVWTYVAPLVLRGILADAYLKHFQRYSISIMLLCDEYVSAVDRNFASINLLRFVSDIQNLYGTHSCTFNVHALIHTTDCVENWGPLWAYSAFQFENFNGVLLKSFRGTQKVITQISNRSVEMIAMQKFGRQVILNGLIGTYYKSLMTGSKFYLKSEAADGGVRFLGPSKLFKFNEREIAQLNRMGVQTNFGSSFKKCVLKQKVFNTVKSDTGKRCNSVISSAAGECLVIQNLVCIPDGKNIAVAICKKLLVDFDKNNPYLINCRRVQSNVNVVLKITDIVKQKFIVQKISRVSCLIRLPNINECE